MPNCVANVKLCGGLFMIEDEFFHRNSKKCDKFIFALAAIVVQ